MANNMEPGKDVVSRALQRPTQGSVRPVNFSVQTGEEFAFEFMRHRAIPKKPQIQEMSGSNNGPDVTELMASKKHPGKDFGMKRVSETESKSHYMSKPRAEGSNKGASHSYNCDSSNSSSKRFKILCSFDGKILPRPSDGKLRHVGGETRLIRIDRDISWQELKQKIDAICNRSHSIKYQLPGEDIDAFISVSCDEDLRNMMEEYSFFEGREGSQRLRIFLFSTSDIGDFSLGSIDGDSEVEYVAAVNGLDAVPRRDSSDHGLRSTTASELDQIINLNLTNNTASATKQIDASLSSLVSVPSHISIEMVHSWSVSDDANMHSNQRTANHLDGSFQEYNPSERFGDLASIISMPLSLPSDYAYTSQYSPSEIDSIASYPQLHYSGNPEVSHEMAKQVSDHMPKQANKVDYMRSLENLTTPVQQQAPVLVTAHLQVQSDVSATQDFSSLYPSAAGKNLDVLSAIKDIPTSQNDESNEDNYETAGFLIAVHSDYEDATTDHIHINQQPHPGRVFSSERISREQTDLLNRLSKSDDSIGSPFPILHNQSDVGHDSVPEACDSAYERSEQHTAAEVPLIGCSISKEGCVQFNDQKESFAVGSPTRQSEVIYHKDPSDTTVLHNRSMLQEKIGAMSNITTSEINDKMASNETRMQHPAANAEVGAKQNIKVPIMDTNRGLQTEHCDQHRTNALLPSHVTEVARASCRIDTAHRQAMCLSENSALSHSVEESMVHGNPNLDISVDIHDRFTPDVLADFFVTAQKAAQASGVSHCFKDDAPLSVNISLEPKSWSFFRNIAKGDFKQNEAMLMDQDLVHDSKLILNTREIDSRVKPYTDGENDEVDQQHTLETAKGFQVDNPFSNLGECMKPLASDFEEPKDDEISSEAVINNSFGDIILDNLQIIKNHDLEELKELGSGTFGTVYHGKWRGSDVAIKRIKKSCFTGRSSEQERLTNEFWREAQILSTLHHPNVVALYGVVKDGPGGTLATVTEYMVNGSLRHVLQWKDKYLDWRKRLIIAMDAAFGMEYLHSKNIVHFDLKCDNLLVNLKDSTRPICKVGDFGLSKMKRNTLVSGGVRGTLPWMAPELLSGSSSKVSEKVDVFSFGIVMWEILTGEEPYANMHYGAIIGGIVNNTLRPPVPVNCDQDWRLLMEQCWSPDPLQRPSFADIAARLRSMSSLSQAKPAK